MANLEGLKGFDHHFNLCIQEHKRLVHMLRVGSNQREQLDKMNDVLFQLISAIGDLVAHNR